MSSDKSVTDPDGHTGKMCNWAVGLKLGDIPLDIQHRAKLIALDGLGCGLIGAHLPWSERASKTVLEIEPMGPCTVFGWPHGLSGPAAALLNSTFIQGFELDDWHSKAPLHSASLLLPALLAAVEHVKTVNGRIITGEAFLLALIVGFETGPRIGLGLGGGDMLSRGWHSGAVFGGPTVAVAVSKLLGSSPRQMEWAIGTACTQAGGLMSAQYGSMAKRMQHGFAARNGLLAALLARANYTGIERVVELPYGGFFTCFGRQSQSPPPNPHFSTLGTEWETNNILTKPYPLMATLHAPVDCIRLLQARHKAQLAITENITSIKIEQAEAAFAHGGWRVNDRSIEVTGAQMSAAYAVALQLTDGEVVPTSFKADKVNRPALFDLIWKTDCMHQPAFDGEGMKLKTRVTICFEGGGEVVGMVEEPRGVEPKMSEGEVLGKWGDGVLGLVGERRCKVIEEGVMGLEKLKGLGELLGELKGEVGSVLD